MFIGQYSHSIDEKGRLIIPSKYREQLGREFVMTKGADGCLSAYPFDEWKKIEERVKEMSLGSKEGRRFMRVFFSSASVLELDKQGRAVIPAALREFAQLKKDVELVGNVNRVEVWDRTKWNEYLEESDMDEVSEYVAGEGLIF